MFLEADYEGWLSLCWYPCSGDGVKLIGWLRLVMGGKRWILWGGVVLNLRLEIPITSLGL